MLHIQKNRAIDFICIGRANVDLYAVERDTPLNKVNSFEKSVGGSPANIAVALTRLGAKAGIITKVAKDAMGTFVSEFLQSYGVDVSHLKLDDSGSRTSLVLAEVKQEDCQVLFYRNNPSDILINIDDINEAYIKQAKAVILTGTAFSASPSREAMFATIQYAKQNQTLVVFDMDYRVSEWRSKEDASIYYQLAASQADIIIGNDEEFEILEFMNLSKSDRHTAESLLNAQAQLVVCKYGSKGCTVYQKDGEPVSREIFKVEKLKPYGSGDAFAAAFLHSLINEKLNVTASLKWATAAGAILVSKPGCAEAMPTKEEIEQFIEMYESKS